MLRIVDLVATDLHACLAATALVLNLGFTTHAVSIVALLRALMFATGKETFTKRIASGNGLSAAHPLASYQLFDAVVSTWAEKYL